MFGVVLHRMTATTTMWQREASSYIQVLLDMYNKTLVKNERRVILTQTCDRDMITPFPPSFPLIEYLSLLCRLTFTLLTLAQVLLTIRNLAIVVFTLFLSKPSRKQGMSEGTFSLMINDRQTDKFFNFSPIENDSMEFDGRKMEELVFSCTPVCLDVKQIDVDDWEEVS